jgi:hypothetical protein
LWLRLIEHHEAENLPLVLVYYRVHPGQISQRKIRVQRTAADRARYSALDRLARVGKARQAPVGFKCSLVQRMQGNRPTIGSDYLWWINLYCRMGRPDLASRLLLPSLLSAPLSTKVYKAGIQVVMSTRRARSVIKILRWYRQKAFLLVRGRRDR